MQVNKVYKDLQEQNENKQEYGTTERTTARDFINLLQSKKKGIGKQLSLTYTPQATEDIGLQLAETDFGKSTYDDHVQSNMMLENLQDVRAYNQPWISKLANGIGKGAVLAGTTFLDGTIGLITGLASIPSQGIDGIWNNGVSNALQEFNRDMEQWLPNYRTQEEIDRPWYQNLGTMNFWADGVLKNLGFTVGAFYSGGVWNKALQGIGWLKKASTAQGVGSFLSAFNEGRIEANNAQREFMESQEAQIMQARNMKALEILKSNLDEFTKEELLQQLDQDSKELLADAGERAQGVGLTTLIANTVLLTATNLWEFGKLYGRGFENASTLAKGTRKVGNKYIFDGMSRGQAIAKGASNGLIEGFEEMNQALIAETAGYMQSPDSPNAYYEALLDPDAKIQTNDFMSSLAQGFVNTYGNGDRWEEFAIGAITGLLGMPTFGKVQNSDANTWIGRGKAVGISGGLLGSMRQAKEQNAEGQANVDAMNKYLEKFENQVNHFAQSQSFTNAMDGWAAASNKFEFQNASNNEDFTAIARFARAGKLQDLKELVNQDFENFDEERLKQIAAFTTSDMQLDGEGNPITHNEDGSPKVGSWRNADGTLMSDTEEGRKKMKEELIKKRDKILSEIDRYEKSVRKIRAIGNNSLDEDRVENLAWLDWKIGTFESRYESLKDKQLNFLNTLATSINNFIQLNSEESVSEEEMTSSPGRQPRESIAEYKERLRKRNVTRQQTLDLNTKEGQTTLKNLQTILDYIDVVRNSETALKMSSFIEGNPELLEYMKNDIYGNTLLEEISGIDHTSFQENLKDIEDIGNIAKATRNFQDTLKDFIEHPINEIKHRSKIEAKVRNTINNRKSKRNKNIADSIARRIDFEGDTMSIAKALQDNAEDIEKVGGMDAWLENLTDDQKAKVRKAQTLQKGANSLKDQIDGSEEIKDDRLKRLAKQFIDEAAQGANTIEEIEKKVYKLLNENTLDDKIRQNAKGISDLETERTIAETKQVLKGIFDDSFERIKKDVDEMNKIDKAKAAQEKKQAEKLKDEEEGGKKRVPKEQKPKTPTENSPRVPTEPETIVPQEPGEAKRQMRETNDKISQTLEKTNPKEYNRPQITEAYLHGYDKESYIEYITKHKDAIPTLRVATRQQYIKAERKIYEHLKKEKAFEYIKERLKVGDIIDFFVDEQLNKDAGTFVVLIGIKNKNGKIVQVIGSMPTEINFNSITKIALEDEEGNPTGKYAEDEDGETLAQRNPERYKLFQYIKKQYEEDSEKKPNTSYFTTKVEQLMGGNLPRSNKESSVASIFENTGHSPIIAIVNQDGTIDSGNQDINDNIIGSDFQTEGQVYVLIRANNGTYVPALTYSTPLIDKIDNSEDWYINQILDKLQKATTELNVPNSTYDQELYKWLRLSGLSARLKYREKNQWITDTSKNIETATHLVLNFDDEQGNHKIVSIPLTDKEISREEALKGLREAIRLSKNVTTNIILGELNSPHREEYIKNISSYLHTNIIKGETHTINDWFTYEYSGEKPNRQRMKNEGQREAGKTKVTKDPVTVNVDGKNYTVESDYVTRDDGTLVEVGTEEYERVMNPQTSNPQSDDTSVTEPVNTTEDTPKSTSQLLADTLAEMSDTKPKTKPTVKKKGRKFLKVEDTTDTATTQEQIQRDIENVKRMFPELSKEGRVRLVNGIIRTIDENGNPVEAYAEFREGILYISDASPKGSAFHETFHYIVDMLLDNNETEEMFKAAELKFKTTDRMALEEKLAERFRDYMNGMTDSSIKGILKNIFVKLKHIIDNIKGNTNYLDNLFYSIYSKKMITKNPSNNQGLSVNQDDNSFYRGQFDEPHIDSNCNLVLYSREDSLYEKAGYKESKGVSVTRDLKSAIEYGEGQLETRINLVMDNSMDESEQIAVINNGYYLIQFKDSVSNEEIKEAGESKLIGNITVPKGSYVIEHYVQGELIETIGNINNHQIKSATDNTGAFSRANNNIYNSFEKALLDYRYKKTDYSNLNEATRSYLAERGITEEEYQALSAEQREYLLHCM